jgi:Deoxyribonuclease II.
MGAVMQGLFKVLAASWLCLIFALAPSLAEPSPLLKDGVAVDWWFAFKLNATFPGCSNAERMCLFGGSVQNYKKWGQQFVYASSAEKTLQKGEGCSGDSVSDPLGASFDAIYSGALFYVVWNDQFYDDPKIDGCSKSCGAPWGHSKGVVAWDPDGNGFLIQVTTPSWPAAGSKAHPRMQDGNTLGCVTDNNVLVSQHFFSLKLNKDDLLAVLKSLGNASVVTNPGDPQLVFNGGPEEVQAEVKTLGQKSASTDVMEFTLSRGVRLISKPSALHVPPWQMLSAVLGGVPLRAATWWAAPKIYSTTAETEMVCWADTLAKPGAVEIALSGSWDGTAFALDGGLGANKNHAKIGVSTDPGSSLVVFGDLNQQGDAVVKDDKACGRSQNGRGGMFFVLDDKALHDSVAGLIAGDSAPADPGTK